MTSPLVEVQPVHELAVSICSAFLHHQDSLEDMLAQRKPNREFDDTASLYA
jgi:hypothetical protein